MFKCNKALKPGEGMTKKEDHNIPKDYEKSLKNNIEPVTSQIISGSSSSGGKRLHITMPHISKKSITTFLIATILISGGVVAGYLYYKNNPISVVNNEQTINKGEQGEEPATPEQIKEQIAALDSKEKNSENYEQLGLLYLQKGDNNLAIINLNKALEGDNVSDEKNIYSALALAYYNNKQNDMAIKSYEKLIVLYDVPEKTDLDQYQIDTYKRTIDRINQRLEL